MYCPNCNSEIPVEAKFCPKCGFSIKGKSPEKVAVSPNIDISPTITASGNEEAKVEFSPHVTVSQAITLESITKPEITIRDLELLKGKIEEISHNRVGVEKLKRDVKTLESSKIIVEMVETSYQKAVRTEYFLDKLKLLEGYVEGQSGRLTSEINGFKRFLRVELFEYVDEEHKEDVRRFCRNLLDIWIAEVLKER
ncbi:MAG: zinc ribbon domain-containing protein [Methanophagales archaeon]|nr:zinc ribbon domain-containing protein [Methanophagales archaeon]